MFQDDEEEVEHSYPPLPFSTVPAVALEDSLQRNLNYKFDNPIFQMQALRPRAPCFERLEFLGDRVLGLMTAHCLHKAYPLKDRDWLSNSFSILVSKSVLSQIYKELGIPSSELFSSHYSPPVYGPIAEKTASDIIEALMGSIYLDKGFAAAYQAHEKLFREYFVVNRKANTPSKKISSKSNLSALGKSLQSLQEELLYHFKNTSFLLEAFHHPSKGGNFFKKLDFMGVRVLALAIAEKVFKDNPEGEEGFLTQDFEKSVNNDNLERVFQSWQLWRPLQKQYGGIITSVLAPQRVPQRMAVDTVRALIGAIYLDGGWKEAQCATYKLLFSEPGENYMQTKTLLLSPTHSSSCGLLLKKENKKVTSESKVSVNQPPSFALQPEEWPSLSSENEILPSKQSKDSQEIIRMPKQKSQTTCYLPNQPTYRDTLMKETSAQKEEKGLSPKQEIWPALNNQRTSIPPIPVWPKPKSIPHTPMIK